MKRIKDIKKILGKIKRSLLHRWLPKQLELFLVVKGDKNRISYQIPDGYFIRNYRESDQDQIISLMRKCGFSEEDYARSKLVIEITKCVPWGYFVIEHKASKQIVGAFMARHNFDKIHNASGRIDYLAVHPDHRGNGLGYALTALTVNRLIEIGYKIIFVGTYDDRLAGIKIYLKSGFVPNIFESDMRERWKRICLTLGLDYNYEEWERQKKEANIFSSIKK